jgi:uncharacterized membrane protein
MESYYLDWANLLLRWVHVITAVAWIGASFYFVMLDNSLEKPEDQESLDKGVGGEQWAVHGGGFYNMQKYTLSPKKLPDHLHWSYWESYSTWLSGFALFTMSYLWNASTYLIDKSKMDWQPGAAIGVALASGWCTTASARPSAGASMATPSSGCSWRSSSRSRPGSPATGSRAARPSCWSVR